MDLIRVMCILMALAMFQLSHAQDSPQDFLDAHNSARAEDGVGPIAWSQRLANYALNYASQLAVDCKMVHSGGPYGENLSWGRPDRTGTAAVNSWVREKSYYDYNSNSCVGGQCGHYTQVVWSNSVRLGCAKVRCSNGGGAIVSCNYDPPGNYRGQRPY